jgi:hypothetical protein
MTCPFRKKAEKTLVVYKYDFERGANERGRHSGGLRVCEHDVGRAECPTR